MPQTTDVFHAAIEEGQARVLDPALTPGGRVAWTLQVAANWPIHPAHRAEAARITREFTESAVKDLERMDYAALQVKRAAFHTAITHGGLSQAPVEPSQSDLWRSHAKANRWTDGDFELLLSWGTREGQKIEDLNWERAVISGGRTFALRDLRLSQKSSTNVMSADEWLAAHYPPIRDPNAPAPTPPVIVAGAVASGPGMVYSDRQVFDSTRASHENRK